MSLFLDMGTGAGLAGATGVRPYLPPLLVGVLAREDTGIDFDGTDWSFLESTAFLAVVLALAVLAYLIERSRSRTAPAEGRDPIVVATGVLGIVLGALLFAGSIAQSSESSSWIGLIAGPICAALGWLAIGGLLERARARLLKGGSSVAMLMTAADAAALALAAIAVFVPPLSFVAIIAFVVLLVAGRGREDTKYAGLRILR
jgi:uncharacterized membrane protein